MWSVSIFSLLILPVPGVVAGLEEKAAGAQLGAGTRGVRVRACVLPCFPLLQGSTKPVSISLSPPLADLRSETALCLSP